MYNVRWRICVRKTVGEWKMAENFNRQRTLDSIGSILRSWLENKEQSRDLIHERMKSIDMIASRIMYIFETNIYNLQWEESAEYKGTHFPTVVSTHTDAVGCQCPRCSTKHELDDNDVKLSSISYSLNKIAKDVP